MRESRFVDEVSRTIRDIQKDRTTASAFASSGFKTRLVTAQTTSTVPSNLDMSAFEDNIYISFLLSNFFLGVIMPTSLMHIHAKDTTSFAAQLSIRALGAAYFGRMHRQEDVMNRGISKYGNALRHLNEDLQDSKKAFSVSVLSSAITLEAYEFIAVSTTAGWIKHAGGIGRLIELRGPERHQTQPERDVFEANRINIVLECWIKRKRCFLEQDKWKTVPWALEPASKDTMSYLQDILCDIPGLMDDAVNLRNPGREAVQKAISYEALSRNILGRLNQLYQWRTRWEEEYPNACDEIPAQQHFDEQAVFFPTMLRFSSTRRADEIVLYNTALILLLRLGAQAIGPTFNASMAAFYLPRTNIQDPLWRSEAKYVQAIATDICKCVMYYLSDYHNRAGVSLLISLRVAYTAFLPTSIQAKLVDTMMTRIAGLNGFEISKKVNSKTLNLLSMTS